MLTFVFLVVTAVLLFLVWLIVLCYIAIGILKLIQYVCKVLDRYRDC